MEGTGTPTPDLIPPGIDDPHEMDLSMMPAEEVGPEKKIPEVKSPEESSAGKKRSARGDLGTVRPMFVDLDGTLIQTDLLHEAILTLAFRAPRDLLGIVWGARHSRAALKQQLARAVHPDAATLPYRPEVRTLIEMHRASGGRTVLATASDASWGVRVAGQLGIFDDVLASDGVVNCRGDAKLLAIQEYCRRQGFEEFDYVGDSHADIPIWKEATGVHLVAPTVGLRHRVGRLTDRVQTYGTRSGWWTALWKALRPHQWVKNLLVFVPLVASPSIQQLGLWQSALICASCFCLCASAVYLVNDLVDLEADRQHTRKRDRPFAAGTLPVWQGPVLALGLVSAAGGAAWLFLPPTTVSLLVGYFAMTCLYTVLFKRIAMLDVLVLAGLYTLRLFAGASAVGVEVSEWLAAFAMFFFLSLAFSKRFTELDLASRSRQVVLRGRGYRTGDLGLVEVAGVSSGYIAVLVLALYLNSPQARSLYPNHRVLWLVCVVLIYWISRVWLKAKRGELADDPIVFAFRDRASLWLGGVVIMLILAACYP